MRKAIPTSVSLMPEDKAELDKICEETGLSKSQLIQAMIKQCKKNEFLKNLLVKEIINEAGERWATSHNVHFDKKETSDLTDASGVSSNTYQKSTTEIRNWQDYSLEECVRIAKIKWC